MVETELKKDLSSSQILGILAIVGLAILMGGSIVSGMGIYFETFIVNDIPVVTSSGKSAMFPDWIDPLAIGVAIAVLIVVAILIVTKFIKRE